MWVKYWEVGLLGQRNMYLQLIYSARFPSTGVVQISSPPTTLKGAFNRMHHQTSDTPNLMGKRQYFEVALNRISLLWLSWKSFSVRHICIFWSLNSLFHLPFLFFSPIDLLLFSVIKHISRTLVFCDWIANALFPVCQVSFDFSLVSYTMQKFLFDLVEFINLFFFSYSL